MKKVMVIFGTRPEAIKMAPVVKALGASRGLSPFVCVTAQHRGLLDQVLEQFHIQPDIDLDLMRPGQDLSDIMTGVILALRSVLMDTRPDLVLVHGDTTTAVAGAVAAFYAKIPVGHVEAGLRTDDKYSPFPEEMNRRVIGALADLHFAPTTDAVNNLIMENVPSFRTYQTGNTAIDALLWMASRCTPSPIMASLCEGRIPILMTVHRRENFGEPLLRIFRAIRRYAEANPRFQIIYPVHPNPNVQDAAHIHLSGIPNLVLTEPVDYSDLVYLLQRCHIVLTDSGGLQEEAPAFGKPTLVLRDNTERPEAVDAGTAMLVGSDEERILSALATLEDPSSEAYRRMSQASNPFGDGRAAQRIVSIIEGVFSAADKQIERETGAAIMSSWAQASLRAGGGMSPGVSLGAY